MTSTNRDDEIYFMQLRDGGARAIHRETGLDAVCKDYPVFTMNKDAAAKDVLRQVDAQ